MTTITTLNPVAVATPRAADWAANIWLAVSRMGAALQGWAHQRHEHVVVNGRYAEANRLRQVAQGFMSSDPRFAADLYAAADRHERAE